MNSEIDLNNFGRGSVSGKEAQNLVGPPRRVFSRYVLPIALLTGFAAVGLFAFRESFVKTVDVVVTMPVPASDEVRNAVVRAAAKPIVAREKKTPLFQAPGWIEPEPYPIVISALRSGTVRSIHIIDGQHVTSGTVVARLVDDDARIAVASAQSALSLREAQYKAARDTWQNPTSLKESIETAKATGDKLQAESRRLREMLELARIEAEVGGTLTRSGYEASLETIRKETQLSASRSQLAETHAQIKLNSATLAAATERLALRIEDRLAVESAEAELLSARAHLDTAKLQLERSVITAPADGVIMRLKASPGSMLSPDMEPGMMVATLYQPEKLQVKVDVPLSEAAKVRPGLPAEVKVEAMPDRVFQAELVNIVPEFDLQKNVLPVKVRIFDPVLELRPEMIARVEFFSASDDKTDLLSPTDNNTTSTVETAITETLLVPQTLVQQFEGKSGVMLAGPDNRATIQLVEAAKTLSNGLVPVISGLRLSDKIIISPPEVEPGTLVRVKGFKEHGTD